MRLAIGDFYRARKVCGSDGQKRVRKFRKFVGLISRHLASYWRAMGRPIGVLLAGILRPIGVGGPRFQHGCLFANAIIVVVTRQRWRWHGVRHGNGSTLESLQESQTVWLPLALTMRLIELLGAAPPGTG